jgi:hypothetical protein
MQYPKESARNRLQGSACRRREQKNSQPGADGVPGLGESLAPSAPYQVFEPKNGRCAIFGPATAVFKAYANPVLTISQSDSNFSSARFVLLSEMCSVDRGAKG